MRLVLDASAAVNALVPGPRRDGVLDRLGGAELWAPGLIDTEVISALARLERTAQITPDGAENALAAWSLLRCERVATTALIAEIWGLRHGIRVADAHYVALARRIDAALLTTDARLGRADLPGVTVLLAR
ncbi:type II toxin-antitoxin system VapC family toxin [Occultella kanbiaonis]|uniref:type II toxin-antitoxin system VapC family toxin n=1 Tax=Occultella kanbiaonis TaxID=2675754 RepID=UPI0013D4884E|nr:type II toxin-antitoxin system VapC family toxin [Occultella kanbiaonis]